MDIDYSSANMMAHYFHHLTLVNRYFFILIAGACAWLTKANNNEFWKDYWIDDVVMDNWIIHCESILYIMGLWLCIRYCYHLPINLLVINIVMAFEPMNYLYNFVRPGIGITIFILALLLQLKIHFRI